MHQIGSSTDLGEGPRRQEAGTKRSRPGAVVLAGLLIGVGLLPVAASAQEEVFPLDGLIVTASPTPRAVGAVATNVTVIDGADVRARGLTTVGDALRGSAGVAIVQNGSFGATTSVFMRGGESDYVLVLVDGVQVNQPGGSFDFSSLTLTNVARIEIVRGPSSALHGSDAVAGVIHVITESGGGATRGSVSSRFGSYGRRDWSASMAGGGARAGYSLSVTRLDTDGILAFNNQHTNTVLNGRARFAPSVASEADISFRIGDRSFHFPTDGSGNVVDRNARSFGDEALVGVKVVHTLTPRLSVEARAAVSDTDGGSEDAQDDAADSIGFFGFASLDHIRRASMDARAHWQTDQLTLTGGWEFEEERQRSFTESLSQWGNSTGRSENSRLNRAYFVHATGGNDEVAFNLGGRIEDNEHFGTFRTWQLGATWVVPSAPGLRVRVSAGRAMKEPTFFEIFATGFAIGNPALQPEIATSWEVGADGSLFGGRIHVRGTWFDQSFRNLIQYTLAPAAPGDPNYFNVAAATGRGAELEARVKGGRLTGGISWTLLASEVTDSGFDQGPAAAFVVGEPLLRRPRHTVQANANARVGGRLNVFADVSVVGVRADRDFSSFPATPVVLRRYSDVGIGASVDVLPAQVGRPGLVLTVRVDNVLDREIQQVFGFDAPGRGVYLGGSLAFGR